MHSVTYTHTRAYTRMHIRDAYIHMHAHLGEVTALGVLCCFALFVCLTLLASFFLPSHLSLKHVYLCSPGATTILAESGKSLDLHVRVSPYTESKSKISIWIN